MAVGGKKGLGGVNMRYNYLLQYKRLAEVCRDLKAALLFSAPSQPKQTTNTNSVLVCIYDTSHLSFFRRF